MDDEYVRMALHDDLVQGLRVAVGLDDERERLLGPDRGE
jgi:hypothetical protein